MEYHNMIFSASLDLNSANMLVLNVKTLGESVILPLKAKDSKPVIVLCDSGGSLCTLASTLEELRD